MKTKLRYITTCSALVALWLFPAFFGGLSPDVESVKAAAAYLLFLAAALLCRLLPDRRAALLSAAAAGAALCALWPAGAFDIVPVVLLCCWLRCYTEQEKGADVRIWFEVFTDLIYAYVVAAIVRLIRSGYAFLRIEKADGMTLPDLCLIALVFLFFVVLCAAGAGKRARPANAGAKTRKKARRVERRIVGVIPVVVSARTFWGFCALLLAVCALQYTNAALIPENTLFFRTGLRFLFFPWMTLLFLVLEAFPPQTARWKRFFKYDFYTGLIVKSDIFNQGEFMPKSKSIKQREKRLLQKKRKRRQIRLMLIGFLVLGIVILFVHDYHNVAKKTGSYHSIINEEPVSFGSYPQTLIVDSNLIGELSQLQIVWKYYDDCFSGNDFYGTMEKTECMKYADAEYKGEKYRAVEIERYRPESTLSPATAEESRQDDNGFELNKIYWFRFEPISWYLCNLSDGFIISEKVLDAMPFQNSLFWIDKNLDGMPNSNKELSASEWFFLPSNLYKNSSLRKWLRTEFYSEAFSKEEQKQLKKSGYRTDESKTKKKYGLFSLNFDKVLLPALIAISEPNNSGKYYSPFWKDELQFAPVTDYARCRGAFAEAAQDGFFSWQWLCTPGDGSADVISICTGDQLINIDRQFYCSSCVGGIRCAAYLKQPKRLIERNEGKKQ